MAPVSKKAKIAARPAAGGGLQKFFGASKSAIPAAADAAVGGDGSKSAAVAETQAVTKEVAPAQVAAPVSNGLTDAQKQRIEENRRKAIERQLAKKNGQAIDKAAVTPSATAKMATSPAKSPSPLKPQTLDMDQGLKRKGGNITPEKAPLPADRRHSNAVIQPNTSTLESEDKFCTFGKVPWKQYNSLYALRLERLRGAALAQAQSLWSCEVPAGNFLPSISATSGSSGDVVIVGVTFKDMPSRNNVIAQYKEPQWATSCLPEEDVDLQESLCSDADTLWLEDGSCRLRLELQAEDVAKHATGFVVAVRGSLTPDGKSFLVKNICLAQASTAVPVPPVPESAVPGQYVALLSGLLIGAPDEDIEARSRAVEFLLGRSETGNEQALSRAVQQVVVCGGVYWTDAKRQVPPGLAEADSMFAQLAEKCPVHVLPGHKDPSNLSLPQMPLHSYFFRSARNCSQFKSVSNPYQCSVGGMQLLGHSGQPIRDLMRCSSIPTPIAALATCLDASLLVPTAPDTLATQPFEKADPFIIETAPQVLFSGGHSEVEYEWREPVATGSSGTLCVCVPSFHKRPAVVLVNLNNPRDVRVMEFGAEKA